MLRRVAQPVTRRPGHVSRYGAGGTRETMRVIVTGATGNIGTNTVRSLAADPRIDAIVGVARRTPRGGIAFAGDEKVSWQAIDLETDALELFTGADAVVHLAWKIQPQRDRPQLRRTNVVGTRRVIDAVLAHSVPALVYASSVGTYAPGPKDRRVDETWPATGIAASTYSRHKAEVEAMLDETERIHPELRVVRMRTSLVFQRAAASEIHRIFLGSLVPWHIPKPLRLIPGVERLVFQATHTDDVADAYRRAVTQTVSGAFNIAAEPVLTPSTIAALVDGRVIPMGEDILRRAAGTTYAMRLQPSEPGWIDMALETPLMSTERARAELGWTPTRSATEALRELLEGMGAGAGGDTRPLHPRRAS